MTDGTPTDEQLLIAVAGELKMLRAVLAATGDVWRWDGMDPEVTGALVGTLMALGVDFELAGGDSADTATIIIRARVGDLEAHRGDWIVRDHSGDFRVLSPTGAARPAEAPAFASPRELRAGDQIMFNDEIVTVREVGGLYNQGVPRGWRITVAGGPDGAGRDVHVPQQQRVRIVRLAR